MGHRAGRHGAVRGEHRALTVTERIAAEIRRHGPLPLERVLEVALYDRAGGFYETGGRSGRRQGDFMTSPEVGPLFGAVVARALDGWWRAMGSPDPFVVVDAGAGPGTLCQTVLASDPDCAPALRYVLVERSAAQRRLHGERLRLEDPALAFAPVDPDTEAPVPEAVRGPICVSMAELPTCTLRLRMAQTDAHYGGNLVAGARVMELFGDLATELAIRHDGDEGLLAGYEIVEFLAPVYAGDFLEATGRIVRVGTTSRTCEFECRKYIESRYDLSDGAADLLDEPVVTTRATGTLVVKKEQQRRP